MLLLAQLAGYSLLSWIIIAILVAGAVAVLVVVLKQFGVAIPPFVVTIFWILVAVVIGVVAVKFIAGLV